MWLSSHSGPFTTNSSVRRMMRANSLTAGQRGSDIRIMPPCERQVLKDVVRALITMGVAYRWFGRPLLRFQDSEKAHARSLRLLRIASNNPLSRGLLRLLYRPRVTVPVSLFGTTYAHPFGLAAGMDKNAKALRGWEATGLSFVEIGGVSCSSSPGIPNRGCFVHRMPRPSSIEWVSTTTEAKNSTRS